MQKGFFSLSITRHTSGLDSVLKPKICCNQKYNMSLIVMNRLSNDVIYPEPDLEVFRLFNLFLVHKPRCVARWRSGRVLDLQSTGRWFEAQPPRCRVQPWTSC